MVWPAVPSKPTAGGETADATGWVDGVDAFLTATEAEVLAVASAQAAAAQAAAVQRANHTGTQAISTVTGLQTALDAKAATSHGHVIADTTGLQTALDGKQPLATVLTNTTAAFTTAQETKLAGIETGATADQTGAEIKTAYEGEANTNAYTDAEKSKLAGVEAGATADQTGAEIKSLYSAEANAYTDAKDTKLAGIEAGADVTDEANVTDALDGATLTDVGTPASGDRVLLQDASDSNILKYAQFSTFGGGGGGGGATVVSKAANEVVNNSTTLQDDDHLTFSIGASENWAATFVLFANTRGVSDLKVAITAPAGATVLLGTDSGNRGTDALMQKVDTVSGSGTAMTILTGSDNQLFVLQVGIRNSTTAGAVTLRWAQDTAQVFDTTIKAGSFLVANKVA